ncbi:MAG: hypothetical protein V3T70_01775 [Phycisphaerae bacterium]
MNWIEIAIVGFQIFTELWTNLFSVPILGDLLLFDPLDILLSGILAFVG